MELRYQRSTTALLAPFATSNHRFVAVIEYEKQIQLEGVSNRLRVIL